MLRLVSLTMLHTLRKEKHQLLKQILGCRISNEYRFGLDKENFYLQTIISNMEVSTVRIRISVFLLFRA